MRALALRLRAVGLDVVLDALMNEERWNMGGPNEGWLTWSYAQVDTNTNDRVLIIATPSYSQVYENKAPAGVGVGAAIEARRIFLQLADAKGVSERFRVVILDKGDEIGLPDQLRDYHQFKPNQRADDLAHLITWLTDGLVTSGPVSMPLGVIAAAYPVAPVAVGRDGFVNCAAAFETFEAMLTATAAQRLLMVTGHGNQGKSTLLNIFYLHCRSLLGSKCVARVEFKKGGATPEECIRSLARALAVPVPPVGNIDERVHAVLDACRQKPSIVLFDAYEHAELPHRHWVNLVLERTLEDDLLRCIVAGRELPPSRSQPWGKLAHMVDCDALKDKQAIIEHAFAQGYKGRPEEIGAVVSTFVMLRDRAVKTGSDNHGISSQALLEELQSMCSSGGCFA